MFAIIECGGKQYKVSENDVISVEKLDNAVGDKVTLNVLLVSDNGSVVAGNPIVAGAGIFLITNVYSCIFDE